jgi:predicted Rossmann-fold nucleotide-binding protein/inosine/xanthosine triphosphate pyrophosphatase family protein
MANIRFYHEGTQEIPKVLPGQGTSSEVDPLGGPKAEDRIFYYQGLMDEVVKGKRPVVGNQNKGGKWFRDQLREMTKGFLPEDVGAYISVPVVDRLIKYNPSSQQLIESKRDILEDLERSGVKDVRIAGTSFLHTEKFSLPKLVQSHRMTIVPKGDMNTLKEAIELLAAKMEEHKENAKLPADRQQHFYRNHPLVIENPEVSPTAHYWDPLLRGVKILNYDDTKKGGKIEQREFVDFKALASQYGIYITDTREETLALTKTLAKKLPDPERKIAQKPLVPDGSIIYLATGTQKKFHELEQIYKAQGVNVRIRSIHELVDIYVSPDENFKTYEGNAAGKVHAAIDAWHKMDEVTRAARLEDIRKKYGISKDKIFILAEDSGFAFEEPNVVDNNLFSNIRHKVDMTAPFPGTETGHVVPGSGGAQEFFRKAGQAIGDGSRAVRKKSVLALAPLKQETYGEVKMYMVASETKGHFTTTAEPKTGPMQIDNFLVPEGYTQSEAALGAEFYNNFSPRAVAWKALAYEAGISTGKGIVEDYEKEFHAGIVTDSGNYPTAEEARRLKEGKYSNGFSVSTLPSKLVKASDVQDSILQKSDGIVLALDPAKAQTNFWENLYLFSSLIVAEQTHDKFKFWKPLKLVNPKDASGKGAFDYLEDMLNDFHHLGTVGEDPTTLARSVQTVSEAIQQLKDTDRQRYRRMYIPAYATGPKNEPEGEPMTKSFRVGIFCSASTENSAYHDDAERLTRGLIQSDIGIVSGAGMNGSMERITTTSEQLRFTDHKAQHVGSNSPHIQENEGSANHSMHEFLLARNIYERMEYMMDNSDAFAILPGGTGTVQELSLLALLKKRALENTADLYAKGKMGGKDMVIVNTEIGVNGLRRGFYDKLLEIIPQKDFEALGIHVVKSVDEAMEKLKELQHAKEQGHGSSSSSWADRTIYTSPPIEARGV